MTSSCSHTCTSVHTGVDMVIQTSAEDLPPQQNTYMMTSATEFSCSVLILQQLLAKLVKQKFLTIMQNA